MANYASAIWEQMPQLQPRVWYASYSGIFYPVIRDSTAVIYLFTVNQIYGVVKSKARIESMNGIPYYLITATDDDRKNNKAPLRPLVCKQDRNLQTIVGAFYRLFMQIAPNSR